MSDRKVSAHNDTYTALFTQMLPCNKKLERTTADNVIFKEQVVEQSSSSTSVNNQLILLNKEIQK